MQLIGSSPLFSILRTHMGGIVSNQSINTNLEKDEVSDNLDRALSLGKKDDFHLTVSSNSDQLIADNIGQKFQSYSTFLNDQFKISIDSFIVTKYAPDFEDFVFRRLSTISSLPCDDPIDLKGIFQERVLLFFLRVYSDLTILDETLFSDYEIHLKEQAHRTASVLTRLKLRAFRDSIAHLKFQDTTSTSEYSQHNPFVTLTQLQDFVLIFFWSIFYENSWRKKTDEKFSSQTNHKVIMDQKRISLGAEISCLISERSFHVARDEQGLSSKKSDEQAYQMSNQINRHRLSSLLHLYDEIVSHMKDHSTEVFLDRDIKRDWWSFTRFSNHLESLVIPIAINAIDDDFVSFPLIYANRAFEQTTGFNQEEILGTSLLNFLYLKNRQFDISSPSLTPRILSKDYSDSTSPLPIGEYQEEEMERIITAFKTGVSLKIGIKCVRKDHSVYWNFQMLVPVYNVCGHYRYMLSLLCDISQTHITLKTIDYFEEILYWVALVLSSL